MESRKSTSNLKKDISSLLDVVLQEQILTGLVPLLVGPGYFRTVSTALGPWEPEHLLTIRK